MMSQGRVWTVGVAATALLLCLPPAAPADDAKEPPPVDIHSYARPAEARVTRVVLDLDVSFERKAIEGTATLTVERPGSAPLVLDSRGLAISAMTLPDGTPVAFETGKDDPILGAPLTVKLPPGATQLKIAYKTTERATALQWLEPKGTAGGKFPFLFTQSEAIHARSWIPLQDSPGVRVTYAATVRVPKGLTAVMSADRLPTSGDAFEFKMDEAIPPYLIALAVGELAFKPFGPRTGVFAEPSVVEAAAAEFADTEKMVTSVEKRFGPYRWGRYDLLVLPPSFPFGGMENPKLTFATPTILAGDKSLVALVAHELAHSWSGNLVTNATWRDFWLNEGFTTYVQQRVIEDVYGTQAGDMDRVLGLGELREELAKRPPAEQILYIDLAGHDPDDGMTQVPYEKGALFLTTLEKAFGRERFDAFLKGYFDHFAFRSITTADFVAYLRANLFSLDPDAAKTIDVDAWVNKPGLPAGAALPSSPRFSKIEGLAADWASGKIPAQSLGASAWVTQEWVHFLQSLPQPLSAVKMAEFDQAFRLTDRGNSEIACQWLVLAVKNGYTPADARLESFLTTIGRRKFLMPLYGALIKTPEGTKVARTIFAKARPFYHPIASESVAKLLGVPAQ